MINLNPFWIFLQIYIDHKENYGRHGEFNALCSKKGKYSDIKKRRLKPSVFTKSSIFRYFPSFCIQSIIVRKNHISWKF